MKNVIAVGLLTAALFCAASFAQTTPSDPNPSAPPPQPEAQPASPSTAQPPVPQATQSGANSATQGQAASTPRIAPGSVIPVQLIKTLDAKKAKPGDEVVARVTMDLKTSSGEVVVPKDTKVVGRVTQAQARNKEQKESQVAIAFDRAELKGVEMSLPMSIQAVIAPPTSNQNNGGAPDQVAPAGGSAPSSPMGAGRSSGAPGQSQPSNNTAPNAAGNEGTNSAQDGGARPQINGSTQGIVGISNLKLEPAQTAAQGSVLSSEKNNVKVDSGTFMLLKVNQ